MRIHDLECVILLDNTNQSAYAVSMSRTVNLDLLETWLAKNGGVGELARKSRVSPFTIRKIKNRMNPQAPRKRVTQLLLAEAIGVSVEKLFPPVGAGEEEAC
jgi:hypothetical protein